MFFQIGRVNILLLMTTQAMKNLLGKWIRKQSAYMKLDKYKERNSIKISSFNGNESYPDFECMGVDPFMA